jgi:hypothetical protein
LTLPSPEGGEGEGEGAISEWKEIKDVEEGFTVGYLFDISMFVFDPSGLCSRG